jgi:hypothetical protein
LGAAVIGMSNRRSSRVSDRQAYILLFKGLSRFDTAHLHQKVPETPGFRTLQRLRPDNPRCLFESTLTGMDCRAFINRWRSKLNCLLSCYCCECVSLYISRL